ncbi:MAG: hypothetical protein KKB50_06530 [Planctomycetes bacterium]|nr:hypothetical protein [Planctomycetota bacterium]
MLWWRISSIWLVAFTLPVLKPAHADGQRPNAYSAQLHLHASLSEGEGSMASQTNGARQAGVDVLWWTDHDWRTTYYHHVSTFDFEAYVEGLDENEPWTCNRSSEAAGYKWWQVDCSAGFETYSAAISNQQAYQGLRSLRMEGSSSSPAFQPFYYRFTSERQREKRSLASDISLDLAIFPDIVGPDARVAVRILLSTHPPNDQVPDQRQYRLYYLLDNDTPEPYRVGENYYVPLSYTAGQWNAYSLAVTLDAVAGFPFIEARDNSFCRVSLGIESRNGAAGRAYFDAFCINHTLDGDALLAEQRVMLDALAQQFPEVVQLVGTEISYETPHFNEFTIGTELHDYDLLAELSGYADDTGWISKVGAYQQFVAAYVVDTAHQRGGVISYDHPFGASDPGSPPTNTCEEIRDWILGKRAFGADILEVGYRDRGGHDLADHLWVWDDLARNGLYLVGTGTSDSHGGLPSSWLDRENNFVSWVYADAPTKAALIAGLKRGRVYFGDIRLFDGQVDLTTPAGFVMGQIVITDKLQEDVTIQIDGLTSGDRIELVEAEGLTHSFAATGPAFTQLVTIPIDPVAGTFARVEVYDAAGGDRDEKVFSNPLYLVRQAPLEGITSSQAGIDLGGVSSLCFDSFVLTDAAFEESPRVALLTITGVAASGTIVLDCAAWGSPDGVQFDNMTGAWAYADGQLTLSDLNGTGSIVIRKHRAPRPLAECQLVP